MLPEGLVWQPTRCRSTLRLLICAMAIAGPAGPYSLRRCFGNGHQRVARLAFARPPPTSPATLCPAETAGRNRDARIWQYDRDVESCLGSLTSSAPKAALPSCPTATILPPFRIASTSERFGKPDSGPAIERTRLLPGSRMVPPRNAAPNDPTAPRTGTFIRDSRRWRNDIQGSGFICGNFSHQQANTMIPTCSQCRGIVSHATDGKFAE